MASSRGVVGVVVVVLLELLLVVLVLLGLVALGFEEVSGVVVLPDPIEPCELLEPMEPCELVDPIELLPEEVEDGFWPAVESGVAVELPLCPIVLGEDVVLFEPYCPEVEPEVDGVVAPLCDDCDDWSLGVVVVVEVVVD
jgi:hypothetical protein